MTHDYEQLFLKARSQLQFLVNALDAYDLPGADVPGAKELLDAKLREEVGQAKALLAATRMAAMPQMTAKRDIGPRRDAGMTWYRWKLGMWAFSRYRTDTVNDGGLTWRRVYGGLYVRSN